MKAKTKEEIAEKIWKKWFEHYRDGENESGKVLQATIKLIESQSKQPTDSEIEKQFPVSGEMPISETDRINTWKQSGARWLRDQSQLQGEGETGKELYDKLLKAVKLYFKGISSKHLPKEINKAIKNSN